MTKVKNRSKGKPSKRGFPWTWVIVALFLAAFVSVFWLNTQQPSPVPEGARAAIVDQLYTNYPNEEFTTRVTEELEDYGFEVDVYQGDAVTVDLYEKLLTYGYNLLVFRVHSGLMDSAIGYYRGGTFLFSNEPYTQVKHVLKQLNDEVIRAKVAEGYITPGVFAIGPKFITNKGNFDDTVVIVGGCSGLSNDELAQAFVDRGASSYLAWNATVDLDYLDEAMISLVKNLCSKRFTVKRAVELTMATNGPDPKYGALLEYYPRGSGSKTIGELIGK